jgi:hypothetical protein
MARLMDDEVDTIDKMPVIRVAGGLEKIKEETADEDDAQEAHGCEERHMSSL